MNLRNINILKCFNYIYIFNKLLHIKTIKSKNVLSYLYFKFMNYELFI